MNCSDLERLKYLNVILLTGLKNSIECKGGFENTESENEHLEDSKKFFK